MTQFSLFQPQLPSCCPPLYLSLFHHYSHGQRSKRNSSHQTLILWQFYSQLHSLPQYTTGTLYTQTSSLLSLTLYSPRLPPLHTLSPCIFFFFLSTNNLKHLKHAVSDIFYLLISHKAHDKHSLYIGNDVSPWVPSKLSISPYSILIKVRWIFFLH